MLKSKWVMLCPMARTGSSHTSELVDGYDSRTRSHHGLFNEGPFGRWPADEWLKPEDEDYYSSILDEDYRRVGGMEHSGEFLDRFIFTEDSRFNPGWEVVGFKVQYVHFVHMPDLRRYLVDHADIRIIANSRRDLLEHTAAETWCQRGNSRAHRDGETYDFGDVSTCAPDPDSMRATFRNLVRYRQDIIETFDRPGRRFFEWSLEDMFRADGSLDAGNHERLFEFLDIPVDKPFTSTFAKTPRPTAREYLDNFDELAEYFETADGGIWSKYFAVDYDPRTDLSWPALADYDLDSIMIEKDNDAFRAGSTGSPEPVAR